jgi:hypothetical protein
MKAGLLVLCAVLLTGCAPTWRSDAMLKLLHSPYYGRLVDYLEYAPLTVEHGLNPTITPLRAK